MSSEENIYMFLNDPLLYSWALKPGIGGILFLPKGHSANAQGTELWGGGSN